MNKIIKTIISAGFLVTMLSSVAGAGQDAFVRVPGNVLFLIDNSQWMNQVMWHADYDPEVVFPRFCDGLTGTDIAGADPDLDITGWAGGDITMCSKTVNFPTSDDAGSRLNTNYLRWVFGNCADCATADQRAALPDQTRIQAMKEVVVAVINGISILRVGASTFFDSTAKDPDPRGGYVFYSIGPGNAYPWTPNYIKFLDNHKSPLADIMLDPKKPDWIVAGEDNRAPIAEALLNTLWYFVDGGENAKDEGFGDTKGAGGCGKQGPVDFYCQQNFVLIISSGRSANDDLDFFWDDYYPKVGGDLRTTEWRDSICEYHPFEPGWSFTCDYDGDNNEWLRRNDYEWEGTDNLDDVALWGRDSDFSQWMDGEECGNSDEASTVQNVWTYTVAFGRDSTLLQETAANGGGKYFHATSKEELVRVLGRAVEDIISRLVAYSSPTIPSVRSASEPLTTYAMAEFSTSEAPYWEGHLRSYYVRQDGTVIDANMVEVFDEETEEEREDAQPLWDAAYTVPDTLNRYIFTQLGGVMEEFVEANANITEADLAVSTVDHRAQVINYTRGDNLEKIAFGDVVNSTPLMITNPSLLYRDTAIWVNDGEESFRQFAEELQYRDRIMLTGSNVGIFHALQAGTRIDDDNPFTPDPYIEEFYFDTGTGEELWGFVPNTILEDLRVAAIDGTHSYFVDGSSTFANLWIDGIGSGGTPNAAFLDNEKHVTQWEEWRTIVVGSLGKGGAGIFGLDVTDVKNPIFLWERSEATMGQMTSRPNIGKVRAYDGPAASTSDRLEIPIVAYGLGKEATTIAGNGIEILNAYTGDLLWDWTYQAGVGDRDYLTCDFGAPISMYDSDLDEYDDIIIAGDMCGQVWTIWLDGDLIDSDDDYITDRSGPGEYDSTTGLISGWGGHRLIDLDIGTPVGISARPILGYDSFDNLWVIVGTGGDLEDANLVEDTTANGLYVIKHPEHFTSLTDPLGATLRTITVDNLVDTTDLAVDSLCDFVSSDPASADYHTGYYIMFDNNEKLLDEPQLFDDHLVYATYNPIDDSASCIHCNSSCGGGRGGCDVCGGGGWSFVYDRKFSDCGRNQMNLEIDGTLYTDRIKVSGSITINLSVSSFGTQLIIGHRPVQVAWGMSQAGILFKRR
jgi:PilC-like protein with beta-propeller domain